MKLERQGVPSSHWTSVLSSRFYLVLLILLFGLHVGLSLLLPPSQDELYYWTWAQDLQLSYFDHPPLTAYLIALSTWIFGDNIFAIRLPANVITFFIFYMLGTLVKRYQVLIWLLLTPISFILSVFMTPDIPLLICWLGYAIWVMKINRNFSSWSNDPVSRVYHKMPVGFQYWFLGGVLLGLGMLSKYSMLLAPFALILLLAFNYRMRSWLIGYLTHILVGFLLSLPMLIFNIQNYFEPLLFQWQHSSQHTAFGLSQMFKFLGSQTLFLGAVPIFLLPILLFGGKRLRRSPGLQGCFYLFVFSFCFFLAKSTYSHLEANWGLAAYITCWPLAQAIFDRSSFRLGKRILLGLCFAPAILCTFLCMIHIFWPFTFVPPDRDRLNYLRSVYQLSKSIAVDLNAFESQKPLFLPTYQWTAYLRYQKVPAEQMFPGGRQSNFTLKKKPICDEPEALVLVDKQFLDPLLGCFPQSQILKEYSLTVRGQQLQEFQLIKFTK